MLYLYFLHFIVIFLFLKQTSDKVKRRNIYFNSLFVEVSFHIQGRMACRMALQKRNNSWCSKHKQQAAAACPPFFCSFAFHPGYKSINWHHPYLGGASISYYHAFNAHSYTLNLDTSETTYYNHMSFL